LKSITISKNLNTIGSNTFLNCTSLTSIAIPYNITIIEGNAFYGSSELTEVYIPKTVTTIGTDIFVNTKNPLTLYTSPLNNTNPIYNYLQSSGKTVNYKIYPLGLRVTFNQVLDYNTFTACGGVTFTKKTSNNNIFEAVDADPTILDFNTFTDKDKIVKVENIPSTVTCLANFAFSNCSSLETIPILDSVTNIGDNAFIYCSALTSITIPNTITSIGINAFSHCTSLTSVTLSNNLQRIATYVFNNNTSLTSIIIPNSVTHIGDGVFGNCNNLKTVTLSSNLIEIGEQVFENCSNLGYITIPSKIKNITYSLLNNCHSLTSVNLPSKLTNIDNFAFYSCTSLTSINIPSKVTNIGYGAFYSCTSLASINIPSKVNNIREYAFYSCTSLTSINIPSKVTNIRDYAFYMCTSLASIYIPDIVSGIQQDTFTDVPVPFTLYTSPLDNSNPVYSYFNTKYTNTINYVSYIPFFTADTKILTDKGYVVIQDLRPGDLVKTLKHGFLPIYLISTREIQNTISEERLQDNLYVCSNKEYPEVFEDLIITGTHSILVDNLNDGEREKTIEVLGKIYATDGKYRLPVYVDERAKPYEKEGIFCIYNFALENQDYYMNYGIYANGLLVETTT
jgi:hypothetical protein